MNKILLVALVSLLTLIISCNKKDIAAEGASNALSVENRIFDHADILTSTEENGLLEAIKSVETELGSQIAIVTLDTLNGESIEVYSLRTANEFRLGREKIDDGVLITVSLKDRSMRIEVGYGLERIIKDEIAADIIQKDMVPHFKINDFAGGLSKAIMRIKKLIEDNRSLVGKKL